MVIDLYRMVTYDDFPCFSPGPAAAASPHQRENARGQKRRRPLGMINLDPRNGGCSTDDQSWGPGGLGAWGPSQFVESY